MAKSAKVYARIEPELKEKAENILSAPGIPASSAITMFYRQIVLQKSSCSRSSRGTTAGAERMSLARSVKHEGRRERIRPSQKSVCRRGSNSRPAQRKTRETFFARAIVCAPQVR